MAHRWRHGSSQDLRIIDPPPTKRAFIIRPSLLTDQIAEMLSYNPHKEQAFALFRRVQPDRTDIWPVY